MIFLIDNQLPVGLVAHLQKHGLDAIHVTGCDLDRASDQEIWAYAKAQNCVIVSKDEDFLHASALDANGPALVWIRLGNCRNAALFAAIDRVLPDLLQAIESGAKVVEVR
jgi:predicted nuclease of predicted toxin-antitoxin system